MCLSFRNISIIGVLSLLLIIGSCKKEAFTSIDLIEVRTQGSFKFKNDLTLMFKPEKLNEIFVLTNPSNSKLYYSVNGGDVIELKESWIRVDSNFRHLDFYTSSSKSNSEEYRLNLGFSDSLQLSDFCDFKLSPNPVSDVLTLSVTGKLRGEIDLKILDVTAMSKWSSSGFVSESVFKVETNVSDYKPGVYIYKVTMGKRSVFLKFLKQ